MHTKLYLLSLLALCSLTSQELQAQTKNEKTEENSGGTATLNAEQAARPREISIGFPFTKSTPIYEDGLPVSYYQFQQYPYKNWHAGVSAESTSLIDPSDFALMYNDLKYTSTSNSLYGRSKFGGKANYNLNQHGQHQLDLNIAGPIKNGWEYSLSGYENWDPSSNHMTMSEYMVRGEFFKGAVQKHWQDSHGHGTAGLLYQYVNFLEIIDNFGPFVFVGDGSVKELDGFNLGIDNYRPVTREFDYINAKTGAHETQNFIDGNTDKIHTATFKLDYQWNKGTRLSVRSRAKWAGSDRSNATMMGISEATKETGYTYANGDPYEGMVQVRNIAYLNTYERSWMTNATLYGQTNNHLNNWQLGVDYWWNQGGTRTSNVLTGHEVKANPAQLYRNGGAYYNYNSGAEFYEGYEHKAALIAKDSWKTTDWLTLSAGFRAEYLHLYVQSANVIGDETANKRFAGTVERAWSVDKVGKITPHKENFLNGSVYADAKANLGGGFRALANYTFTRQHTNLFRYGAAWNPNTNPRDLQLLRAGVSYHNSWLDITSQLIWANMKNESARQPFSHVLTKQVGNMPAGSIEVITLTPVYGVSSIGWDTDMTIRAFKGFTLHNHIVLKDPKYQDFILTPTFSDGVTNEYDFSGNTITNMPNFELEIEPAYKIGDWRLWLRIYYSSKRYINKTNSLYFNGRIDTFGGVDYKLNKNVSFSVSLTNILNQKGANGNISSADLVTDTSDYKNYVMSGTFIRPFTVELATKISF